MLSIGTANKMFKLIKGIISRISNILNNKKKRVFNSDVKIFCSIPQAKKGTLFDTEIIMPKVSQRTSIIRVSAFDIKNVFNKVFIIQKKMWGK